MAAISSSVSPGYRGRRQQRDCVLECLDAEVCRIRFDTVFVQDGRLHGAGGDSRSFLVGSSLPCPLRPPRSSGPSSDRVGSRRSDVEALLAAGMALPGERRKQPRAFSERCPSSSEPFHQPFAWRPTLGRRRKTSRSTKPDPLSVHRWLADRGQAADTKNSRRTWIGFVLASNHPVHGTSYRPMTPGLICGFDGGGQCQRSGCLFAADRRQ